MQRRNFEKIFGLGVFAAATGVCVPRMVCPVRFEDLPVRMQIDEWVTKRVGENYKLGNVCVVGASKFLQADLEYA